MFPEAPTATNTPETEEEEVVVEVVEEPPSLLLLQEYMVRLNRNREGRMSRCFTWFPNWLLLGEPNIYHQSGYFTRNGDFT